MSPPLGFGHLQASLGSHEMFERGEGVSLTPDTCNIFIYMQLGSEIKNSFVYIPHFSLGRARSQRKVSTLGGGGSSGHRVDTPHFTLVDYCDQGLSEGPPTPSAPRGGGRGQLGDHPLPPLPFPGRNTRCPGLEVLELTSVLSFLLAILLLTSPPLYPNQAFSFRRKSNYLFGRYHIMTPNPFHRQ